jgi:arabinan endo-1,5-alpha-L-arabinosidase
MKLRSLAAAVVLACAGLVPATGADAAAPPAPGAVPPVPRQLSGDIGVHDPSMVRARNGVYYVYGTHNGLGALASRDLVHFRAAGAAFPDGVAWAQDYSGDPRELWAPDVSFHNGRYWLYYAASSFGSNHSAIGLATSRTGEPGQWRDHGIIYSSTSTDDFNAIDPGLTVDRSGRWWLSLGSFWSGIRMIELDPRTGTPALWNATLYTIAQRPAPDAVEGAYIIQHGGYYYAFASYDFCCRGVDSTYNIKVGRSRTITGPYVDRDGVSLLNDGGTPVLATHGSVIGPGGQTVLRVRGRDLLVYHYYDGNDQGNPKLGLNRLIWDRGWPRVA